MTALVGKVSWFGGPRDPEAGTQTASGAPISQPGIAVYNHKTLGGYWRVTAPNGKTQVLRQTDIGPAPWTGRKVDVTYSALHQFGYNEGNFPTDQQVKAEYLGRNIPKQGFTQSGQAHQASITTPETTSERFSFNKQGYQEAAQKARGLRATASLFTGGGPGDSLLREVLNRAGAPPSAQQFGEHRLVKEAGKTFLFPANSGPANALPGGKLNGFLPNGAPLEVKRVDQGQDIKTSPGGAITAPGDGVVKEVKSNPGGFGAAYPVVHFTTGPLAGHDVYIGHTKAALRAGQKFSKGAVLSHTQNGTGPYVGNATGLPGWAEIGLASALGTGNMSAGNQIKPLLGLK